MTRGKVQLKRIQNPVSRRITFSKRKAGLLKKTSELALLCDAEVALLIFSPSGNLYEFGSHSINKVLEKYQKYNGSVRHHMSSPNTIEMLPVEVESLQKTMINYEHMIGEDLDSLSLKELKNLEKKVHLGSRKLRSRKDKILLDYIGSSKNKELPMVSKCSLDECSNIEISISSWLLTLQRAAVYFICSTVIAPAPGEQIEKSLGAENANFCKKICRSHKSGDIDINVIKGDRSDA